MMTVVLIALVGFALPSMACEKCVSAGYNYWVKCEAGYSSGHQTCYGGFGANCTLEGACNDGSGTPGGGGKQKDPFRVAGSDKSPGQGFALRTEGSTGSSSMVQSAPASSNVPAEHAEAPIVKARQDSATDAE